MKKINGITRLSAIILSLIMTVSVFILTPENTSSPVDAATYPYPKLLDYTDLDSSFNSLAASKILSKYRDYILESIKYHIESSTDDYRVAKNLMKAYNPNQDGTVLFFFDGVSMNLDGGATPCFSGYKKNGNRYNMSAVAIVVQANSSGRPQIMFATQNCSTMPDNVRDSSLNDGTPPGSLRDGVYNFQTTVHYTYAGFNIITTANSHVRACTWKASYLGQGSGINIHHRYTSFDYITNSTYNSTGCFNIGGSVNNLTEYNNFVKVITGYSNAGTGYSGYSSGVVKGIVIVDRSNYKVQLATIYGNDSTYGISGGWTGTQIASYITTGSAGWNTDVNNRLVASFVLNSGSKVKVDTSNKTMTGVSLSTSVSALKQQFADTSKMVFKNAAGNTLSDSALIATGCTVSDTDGRGNTTTVTVIIKADADGDGKATVNDYALVKSAFKNKSSLTGVYKQAADVTGNGKITVSDYLMIKRCVNGTYNP